MGLDVQRDNVTAYANEKGWQLVAVVQEAASGGIREGEEFSWEHRPALLGLMQRAEQGEYDILLVPRFDRLSRDYASLIVLERRFGRHGVEIVSVAEEHNGDGPIGEFIRGQLALAAQLERATIRERLSAGKAKGKQLGRHVHGRPPYGYQSEHGILTPNENATVVKRIFQESRDGRTAGRIARILNHEGIPAPQGGAKGWSDAGVRLILRNDAYTGERHGVKRAHPAIISRRLYNETQKRLEAD
jgi:site-specific DNA recombinase